MYPIDSALQAVEEKWLTILYDHCREIFHGSYLPSHDEHHHFRVWLQAKKLMSELGKHRFSFTTGDIEKVIIAVFFHDTGMRQSYGRNHGADSRKIAEDFFLLHKDLPAPSLEDILLVVEKHDDKEYKANLPAGELTPDSLFALVNVSDDLDAYGIIGIYRYAEIYLLRGIPVSSLGSAVLNNLEKRFGFCMDMYGFLSSFIGKQQNRYQVIRRFYHDLMLHPESAASKGDQPYGASGVIHFIRQLILEEQHPLHQVFREVMGRTSDPYVLDYFRELDRELLVNR